MCLITFVTGLKEPLGSSIRAMRPDSLATALAYCIKEQNIYYTQTRPSTYPRYNRQVHTYNTPFYKNFPNRITFNQPRPFISNPRNNSRFEINNESPSNTFRSNPYPNSISNQHQVPFNRNSQYSPLSMAPYQNSFRQFPHQTNMQSIKQPTP